MQKSVFFLTLLTVLTAASAAEIHIAEKIPYEDESRIEHKITSECTEIGSTLSESIVKHAAEKGLTVVRSAHPESQSQYAKVEISAAMSAGNAFIGHAKGISVYGVLYQDGKEVHKTTLSRNSMGGVFGGFKGSCSVLYRTANALGKDVAGWLVSQNKQ